MLVVIPFFNGDADLACKMLEWCAELSGIQKHPCLLVASQGMDEELCQQVVRTAKLAFETVTLIKPKTVNEKGWPESPNHLFYTTATRIARVEKRPWFWLEPDCTPLTSDWIDRLEDAYAKCSKPYMGFRRDIPIPHLTGVAVYPADVSKFNRFSMEPRRNQHGAIPFDCVEGSTTLKHAAITPLIYHDWGTREKPPTYPTRESLDVIPMEAVIAHRCKDFSIGDRLREIRNPSLAKKIGGMLDSAKRLLRPKLKLPNVTLWGCVWSDDQEYFKRTLRVLAYCQRIIQFEHTVLFSYLVPPEEFHGEHVQMPKLPNVDQFNIFVNCQTPAHLKGEFAMSVHEDGFPIETSLWDDRFLDYDYIGAPWVDGVVGNGGFNIESQRFMRAKTKLPPFVPGRVVASDFYVARVHRDLLEKAGMKFAPKDLAEQFSTETTGHNRQSFGFHGKKYAVAKYNLGHRLVAASEKEKV